MGRGETMDKTFNEMDGLYTVHKGVTTRIDIPVIPRFIGNYINACKPKWSLIGAMSSTQLKNYPEVDSWLMLAKHQELFALAWQGICEIGDYPDPVYTTCFRVRDNDEEHGIFLYKNPSGEIKVGTDLLEFNPFNPIYHLTKEEIYNFEPMFMYATKSVNN